jgi:hypothetical protein
MGGLRLGLGGTVGKFKKVMEDPGGRRTVTYAAGAALLLFILYLAMR